MRVAQEYRSSFVFFDHGIQTSNYRTTPNDLDFDSMVSPKNDRMLNGNTIRRCRHLPYPRCLLHLMVFKAIDDTQHDSLERLLQSWPAPTPLEEQNGPQTLGRSL